jgi:hypothetical protein
MVFELQWIYGLSLLKMHPRRFLVDIAIFNAYKSFTLIFCLNSLATVRFAIGLLNLLLCVETIC